MEKPLGFDLLFGINAIKPWVGPRLINCIQSFTKEEVNVCTTIWINSFNSSEVKSLDLSIEMVGLFAV